MSEQDPSAMPSSDRLAFYDRHFAPLRARAAMAEELADQLKWYGDRCSGIHGNCDQEALEEDQGEKAKTLLAKFAATKGTKP